MADRGRLRGAPRMSTGGPAPPTAERTPPKNFWDFVIQLAEWISDRGSWAKVFQLILVLAILLGVPSIATYICIQRFR